MVIVVISHLLASLQLPTFKQNKLVAKAQHNRQRNPKHSQYSSRKVLSLWDLMTLLKWAWILIRAQNPCAIDFGRDLIWLVLWVTKYVEINAVCSWASCLELPRLSRWGLERMFCVRCRLASYLWLACVYLASCWRVSSIKALGRSDWIEV